MAANYHEELATSIVDEILEARNFKEYFVVGNELSAVGYALHVAKGKSRIDCDLIRFMEKDPLCYGNEFIDETMQAFSKRIGTTVYIRTLKLAECLEKRFVNELQTQKDQWQIAKIIYALGTALYDEKRKDKVSQMILNIKDPCQRKLVMPCARVYFERYEEVFEIFCPDEKI